ncbi:MAG TPA: dTMP kinase [Patescibacteria group bacterium]|nr:dTMP kinase [Patescibacteria group bacterium]
MKKGKLIIFEGGEGSGKSTVIKEIGLGLKKEKIKYLITREPGGSRAAEKVRDIILNHKLTPLSQLLGFLLSRSIWVDEVIQPALKKGTIVLADRSYPSSYVYQGLVGGIDLAKIHRWHGEILSGIETSMVVVLDVDHRRGLERSKSTGEVNVFEAKSLRFHKKVNLGYLQLAKKYRWKVVNANQGVDKVVQDCWRLVKETIRR